MRERKNCEKMNKEKNCEREKKMHREGDEEREIERK